MMLTPKRKRSAILPSTDALFLAQLVSGAVHILSGPDHLLFLLVVLAGGWGFAKVVLALTCFTAGHAITLAASALWGLSVSPGIVEPAIAATIVGMALFDRFYPSSTQRFPTALRLALVFGCALIQGLGLAETFSELGLLTDNKLVSLAGFNTGIELGQLAVVVAATAVLGVIERVLGEKWLASAKQLASVAAAGMGFFWMVERILAG